MENFGASVADNLRDPAWMAGELSAIELRSNTGFRNEKPKKAIDELLGGAISAGSQLADSAPGAITALIERSKNTARLSTISKSARQRRFRACTATYLAWTSNPDEVRAATVALTRRQQASRAFAAEMLAPKDALLALAPRHGFDSNDLEEIASDFVCPFDTVMWQAHRAGIPLRDVELPFSSRLRVV